jgi:flagellar basal-body rod modification protein FlgD
MATTTTGPATSTSMNTLPSNIKTTTQYKKEQEDAVLNGNGGEMGQTAFLTLFTTQLQNQNPLDPMDNEAFVAQLAQFSQLEATTRMADSLKTLVGSMTGDRMSSAASLIGKSVAVVDGKAIKSGEPVEGTVTLANDVDGVTLKVYSSTGALVRTGQVGAQKKGEFPFSWDGNDSEGNPMPDGTYRIEATVSRFGTPSKAPVTTMASVRSVTTDALTGDMKVELNDGSLVSLSEVKRIGN